MTRGSSLSDEELAALGVSRTPQQYGNSIYGVPCAVCGRPVHTRSYNTDKAYKCKLCRSDVAKIRNAMVKAVKEAHERMLAREAGTDYEHLHRFEKGAEKFGDSYAEDIEAARSVASRFDSIPEVIACISLLHIGARVIAHQRVGDFTVDFCLPDEKVVIEIDGSLYHTDETKEFMRDYALKNMLGNGWVVRHIPADAVAKKHVVFERSMRKMLNARREEQGLKPLAKS